MLANAAPVAADDAYIFYGFVEHNVASGVPSTYIEAGSSWYSSTDGSDQNAINPDWRLGPEEGFDPASGNETGWTALPQPAKFGFGDGNEVTTVPIGHRTYYFFRTFDIAGRTPDSLRLRLLVDDCAAVYVNGREIHRTSTLPQGAGNDTLCDMHVPTQDELRFFDFAVEANELHAAGNTIAVEVHQATVVSSDLGFDLSLHAGDGGLLANDFDADDPLDDLRVEVVDASQALAFGTLDVSTDGAVAFTPANAEVEGRFTFSYQVVDDGDPTPPAQTSSVATVSVAVRSCDCPAPVAVDDVSVMQFVTDEDTRLLIDAASGPVGPAGVGVLANDTIFRSAPAVPIVVTQPANGFVELNESTGGFSYWPNRDFHGVDSFTYRLWDGFKTSNDATVEIVVNAIDDPPTPSPDWYFVMSPFRLDAASVLSNDRDADGDSIENVASVPGSGPINGTLLDLRADGTFSYLPFAGFEGFDSFDYTITAGGVTSPPTTVTIVVGPDERIVTAIEDFYEIGPFSTLATNASTGVLVNDTSNSAVFVLIPDAPAGITIEQPGIGTLTWLNTTQVAGITVSDGSFLFTPAAPGAAFTHEYTIIDVNGDSDTATLFIFVATESYHDLNSDGVVGRGDLPILLANFGRVAIEPPSSIVGDLNFDGRVSLLDAIALRNAFTPPSSPAAAVVAGRTPATRTVTVDRCMECAGGVASATREERLFASRSRRAALHAGRAADEALALSAASGSAASGSATERHAGNVRRRVRSR
jgi:hypothetical protein